MQPRHYRGGVHPGVLELFHQVGHLVVVVSHVLVVLGGRLGTDLAQPVQHLGCLTGVRALVDIVVVLVISGKMQATGQ